MNAASETTLPPKPDRSKFELLRAKYKVLQIKHGDVESDRTNLKRELERCEAKLAKLQAECDLIVDQLAYDDGARFEAPDGKELLSWLERYEASRTIDNQEPQKSDGNVATDMNTDADADDKPDAEAGGQDMSSSADQQIDASKYNKDELELLQHFAAA